MRTETYGLSARDELALDAAKLYHSGLTQQQVADRLFVNRATVSKLLKTAKLKGLIYTEVRDPRELDVALRDGLSRKYGLASVRIVAPVGRGPMDLRRALGHAGATVVESLVQDGDTIGIWWSNTTVELAFSVERTELHSVNIVDLNGTDPAHTANPTWEHGRHVLTHTMGAQSHVMRAPLIFPTLNSKLEAELTPSLRSILQAQASCRIAIFSTTTAQALMASMPEAFASSDSRAPTNAAAGHVCGRLIDANGRICAPFTNQRTTGLPLPALRGIEQKVLVSGGSHKVAAMNAILANRYANHLVTDVTTARQLLEVRNDNGSRPTSADPE